MVYDQQSRRLPPLTSIGCWSILIILPFLVQLPSLTGWLNADPVARYTDLASSTNPGLVPGEPTTDPNVETTSLALGHLAARMWLAGKIPWWNSFEGVGLPLAGEMQSAALFPFTLLLDLRNGQMLFHLVLQVLAGLSTYALLRQLGCSSFASAVGGIVYQFNGTFAWLANAPVNPLPFLPLLLLGIERARAATIKDQPLTRGWSTIAISIALSIYSGFPEVTYLGGLLASAWATLRIAQNGKTRLISLVLRMTAGVGVGVLLAAPLLIAFWDYLLEADVNAHAGLLDTARVPLETLSQILSPYLYGNIYEFRLPQITFMWYVAGGYLGTALTAFSLLALRSRSESGLRLVLFASIWLTISKMLGVPVITDVANHLPFMTSVAMFRYGPIIFEMAAVILAAFVVDDATRMQSSAVFGVVSTVLVAIATFSTAYLTGRALMAQVFGEHLYSAWLFASLLMSTVVLLVVACSCGSIPKGRVKQLVLGIVLSLETILLFTIPTLSNYRDIQVEYGGVSFLQTHLGFNRFYTLGPITSNNGSYFEIASVNYIDVPISTRWAKYVHTHLDPYTIPVIFDVAGRRDPASQPTYEQTFRERVLDFEAVGVKYLVAPAGDVVFQSGDQEYPTIVYTDKVMTIFELPHPRPYFEVVSGACLLSVVDRTTVRSTCNSPGVMVRRELYFPGWSAATDGKPEPILLHEGIFQAIALPMGEHVVHFWFLPEHVGDVGLVAFGFGVLAVVISLSYRRGFQLDGQSTSFGSRLEVEDTGVYDI